MTLIQKVMASQTGATQKNIVNLSLLRTVLQEDHLNNAVLRACERLDLAMHDMKKNFICKAEVLVSVLENLMTDCLTRISPEITSLLFRYLLRHTLLLVLHGDWELNKSVKSHMSSLFKQFKIRAEKKKLSEDVGTIEYLLDLMSNDPWGNSALMTTLSGGNVNKSEFMEFFKKEIGIFLVVRFQVMIYAQCEHQVIILIEKCLECVHSSTHIFLPYFSDEITYFKDLHLNLLIKTHSDLVDRRKIVDELSKIGLEECLKCVYRSEQGLLPFFTFSKKTTGVIVNMALASAVIKRDTDESILKELIKVWFDSLPDSQGLSRLLRHIAQNAACSRYIYTFGEMLTERLKLSEKALCVEIYVRGLTLNVNEIEVYELNNERDKVREYKVHLSNGFLKLGDYLKEDFLLYRECVLTAFSVAPSSSCYEKIKSLGEKHEKFFIETKKKNDGIVNNPSLISHGELLLPQYDNNMPQCDNNMPLCDNNMPLCDNNMHKCDKTMPRYDNNLAVAMEECELDPVPVLEKAILDCSDVMKDCSDVMEGNRQFYEKSPPRLSPQRPIGDGFVSHDWTKALNASLKNDSVTDQVLDENQINGDVLKEISKCALTNEVSKLTLDVDDNDKRNHNKKNTCGSTNTCSMAGLSQSEQAYDGKTVGIPQDLCDDLSTLVGYGRHQELAWDLEWAELRRRCETYLMKVIKNQEICDKKVFTEEQGKIHSKAVDANPNQGLETSIRTSKRKRKKKQFAEYY